MMRTRLTNSNNDVQENVFWITMTDLLLGLSVIFIVLFVLAMTGFSQAKLQEQKRFNEAARTYLQNDAKWKAAIAWCQDRGIEFKVFTEVTLQKMGII